MDDVDLPNRWNACALPGVPELIACRAGEGAAGHIPSVGSLSPSPREKRLSLGPPEQKENSTRMIAVELPRSFPNERSV